MTDPAETPAPIDKNRPVDKRVRPGAILQHLGTASSVCIIDLPSHVGTPATWRSRSHPTMTVCDRHADQYASAYDDDTRVDDWEPIEAAHNGR